MSNEVDFKELNDLYDYIESKNPDSNWIAKSFIKLRDLKVEENKLDESKISQWEIDFFTFDIIDGKLEQVWTWIEEDGKKNGYPSLESFDDNTYEYLDKRLKETDNIYFKARYSTILWHSPKKHGKYAKISVDSFLEITEKYKNKINDEPESVWGHKTLLTIRNAYFISKNSKYKTNEIKSKIIKLVKDVSSVSESSFVLNLDLINLMLEEKKIFVKDDFSGFEKICLYIYEILKEKDLHYCITALELGKKVDNKLKVTSHNWDRGIAEIYELLMEKEFKNQSFIALNHCLSALNIYKKLNDLEKIEFLERKYREINEKIEFKEIKFELKDYQKHIKEIEDNANIIIDENDPITIIEYLMDGKFVLPTFEYLDKLTDGIIETFPLLAMSSKVNFDQSGHPSEHFVTDDQKKYHEIIRHYHLYIELVSKNFLWFLFILASRKEILSPSIIVNFLREKTWLGREIVYTIAGKEIKHDWIVLLTPSIDEYFKQIVIYLYNPKNTLNFVLSIDSLVLKLEGIIRDFCYKNNITTFEEFKDGTKSKVREKTLSKLLNDKKLEKIIGKDDLLYIKFLLIEQGGYNLRNKIAHSLVSNNDYNIGNLHLLLLALFRLAKYEFKEVESKEQ